MHTRELTHHRRKRNTQNDTFLSPEIYLHLVKYAVRRKTKDMSANGYSLGDSTSRKKKHSERGRQHLPLPRTSGFKA